MIRIVEIACDNTPVMNFLSARGISVDTALAAGVDLCGNALGYPRVTPEGELIGYKYRNVENGKVWHEPAGYTGKLLPFQALVHGYPSIVALTEGETDALKLATESERLFSGFAGSLAVYAIPGASAFKRWWSVLLRGKTVIVFPDADRAGESLAVSVARVVPQALIVRLESGDVCEASYSELFDAIDAARPIDLADIPSRSLRQSRHIGKVHDEVLRDRLFFEASRLTDLRRRGMEWSGKCPFHDENTPSFMVNPDKGVWYCHGCLSGGTVIDLLMLRDSASYDDVVSRLVGGEW